MKYDYLCKSCRNSFTVNLPLDTPIVRGRHVGARCTVCGSSSVRKLINPVSVTFKGRGFYATDNAKENVKEGTKKDE